jgi:hypothetical protein
LCLGELLSGAMHTSPSVGPRERLPELSDWDADVVGRVTARYNNQEIVGRLDLGARTVRTDKGYSPEKRGLLGRPDLVPVHGGAAGCK